MADAWRCRTIGYFDREPQVTESWSGHILLKQFVNRTSYKAGANATTLFARLAIEVLFVRGGIAFGGVHCAVAMFRRRIDCVEL